jgi:hypothetical protein
MIVIEKNYMEAVIAMNRKMADQNKVDWERYRMDAAQNVATYCMGLYLARDLNDRPTYDEIAEAAVKMADALVAELQKEKENQETTI